VLVFVNAEPAIEKPFGYAPIQCPEEVRRKIAGDVPSERSERSNACGRRRCGESEAEP